MKIPDSGPFPSETKNPPATGTFATEANAVMELIPGVVANVTSG
jgi:hypothetical protein